MTRTIVALIITALLSSCGYLSYDVQKDIEKMEVCYVRDTRTGLCFAATGSLSSDGYTIISITCVPCDSLRQIPVQDIMPSPERRYR